MADAFTLGYVANAALGMGLVALALLLARERRWLFSIFLGLVGANYVADALRFVPRLWGAGEFHSGPLGTVLNLIDPAVLVLASVQATGRRVSTPLALAVLGPPLVLAAAIVGATQAGLVVEGSRVLVPLMMVLGYASAFVILARGWRGSSDAETRDTLGALVVAVGVIALARIPLTYVDLGFAPGLSGRTRPGTLIMEAGLGTLLVAFAWWARRAERGVLRSLSLVLAAVAATWLLRFVPGVQQAAFALLYSVRWFLFVGVVAGSPAAQAALGLGPRSRSLLRAGAITLLLTFTVAEAAALIAAPTADDGALLVGAGLLVAAVALALLGLRALAPARSELGWRSLSIYRARVELGASDEELEGLRERLGLRPRDAADVRAQVRLEQERAPLESTLAPGLVFRGRYEVQELVGAGAFGRAFLAWDRAAGERVVLKELQQAWRRDPEAADRFRREAETAMRLRHDALVGFRAVEPAGKGAHVLVLDAVEGETLRDRLRRGALPQDAAASLARDLLAALAALHASGIVHRDVKPENVILRPGGGAVLLDFGAAGETRGGTRAAGGRPHPGTPEYMSPEQRDGGTVGPTSDVYAAALVLREAMGGSVPDAWRTPLQRALDERPEARPSAAELAALLRA